MRATVFDLETTDLGGNFGRLLCSSFLDLGADPDTTTTYRRDMKPWKGRKLTDDGKLAVAIRNRLEQADIVIGWNSILFDVPFLNARLAAVGERPLKLGEKFGSFHLDLMYYAGGSSMRLGSKRLEKVTKFFHVAHEKTPLTEEVWADAASGDRDAMEKVVEHCIADVQATADVFPHLAPFVKKVQFNLSEVYQFLADIPSRR